MSRNKILVVDDEPDVVEMVKMRLEANGYGVATASSGEEAVEKIKKDMPDLVILDVKMDRMDGYTTLRAIRQDPLTKTLPVVMLTAYGHMQDLFKLEGVTDYIVKPYNDQDFLLRVARALNKKE